MFLAVTSPSQGRKLIKEFQPDIVIGTGGYVCWPTLKAAAEMRVHTAIHESNSTPGLAVKVLSHFVERIWINYDNVGKKLRKPKKILKVGNPVRDEFFEISRGNALKTAQDVRKSGATVLYSGGSLGADTINKCAIEFIKEMAISHPEIEHIHISGPKSYDKIKAIYSDLGFNKLDNVKLIAYADNMPELMTRADIVVSRAGALTLSELALAAKAAVLIPSPNVTANHQYHNAKALADEKSLRKTSKAFR